MPERDGHGQDDLRCFHRTGTGIIVPMRILAAMGFAVLAAAAVSTAAAPDDAPRKVRAVLESGTLELADGRQVRLAQVRLPDPWKGDADVFDRARDALVGLVLNRDVVLRFPGPRFDRYGRLVARVEWPDGTWVQALLVARGWAIVASDEDRVDGLADLLRREDAARRAGRGLWADWRYAVRDPLSAAKAPEGYRVVEGTVAAVATVGSWTYLNFGEDWRSDFTVSVHRRDRRRMEQELGALAGLQGRQVRVRGWMRHFNGPMIEATYPQQIELLP